MSLCLQDFEALTPNILARTIETVEGGGLVVLLLRSLPSLTSLFTMVMVSYLFTFVYEFVPHVSNANLSQSQKNGYRLVFFSSGSSWLQLQMGAMAKKYVETLIVLKERVAVRVFLSFTPVEIY